MNRFERYFRSPRHRRWVWASSKSQRFVLGRCTSRSRDKTDSTRAAFLWIGFLHATMPLETNSFLVSVLASRKCDRELLFHTCSTQTICGERADDFIGAKLETMWSHHRICRPSKYLFQRKLQWTNTQKKIYLSNNTERDRPACSDYCPAASIVRWLIVSRVREDSIHPSAQHTEKRCRSVPGIVKGAP